MKKLYTIILATTISLFSINANASIGYISVGASGANAFVPSTLTVHVGDSIQWVSVGGVHNVTSGTIPAGAATFVSTNPMPTIFYYHVTVAGTYGYYCSNHGTATSGMFGSFTATATSGAGITNPTLNIATSAYPSPCVDKITFKYNGISKISMFNMLGANVRNIEVPANEGQVDMDLSGLDAGVYFYATYKDGVVFETKKIVKTK